VSNAVLRVDDEVRRRLTARFGAGVAEWLDELPRVLGFLADRWEVELGSPIPRGSVAVVIRCTTKVGSPAVLKISPDRPRLATEAAALEAWDTAHSPSVLAVDAEAGAMLLEAIEPGTALIDTETYPELSSIAKLLTALYGSGIPNASYPTLGARVDYLFESGTAPYKRRPALLDVVPLELYERGRQFAGRLVNDVSPTALLHGDLTPRNILEGGDRRGLVAIDPAPCLGADLAFDAIDLVLWQAEDVDTIAERAEQLAGAIDVDAARLLDWCSAFAAMVALEHAEESGSPKRIDAALALADRAPVRRP
jgi:streptomycin 6-kinase